MSFRLKIFLAVGVPAVVLVAAAAAVAYDRVRRQAEGRADQDVAQARKAFEAMLSQSFDTLSRQVEPFRAARFSATLEAFVRGDIEQKEFEDQIVVFQGISANRPLLCTWADAEFRVRLRQVLVAEKYENHACSTAPCPHPETVVLGLDGVRGLVVAEPLGLAAAAGFELDAGFVIAGRPIREELRSLAESSGVGLVVSENDTIIDSSLPGITSTMLHSREEVELGGKLYRFQKIGGYGTIFLVAGVSMELRESMKQAILRTAVLMVAAAVVLSLAVATGLSRAMSRPVVELEAASRKVGEGDLSVQVTVRSRDELGRLGGAFNEMVRHLKKRTEVMQKTLSEQVERQIMAGGDVKLGGRTVMGTIMFLDVRGYTTMTEGMDPAQVLELVNQVMTRMERCIRRHHGVVNKYMGDGCMALFGVPDSVGNDALNAVEAGRDVQTEMKLWNEERKAVHQPPVFVGIGINTDEVLAGFVGSEARLEFTTLGEGTNLASRLCSKAERGQTLASYTTYRDAGVTGRELEPVHVKGFSVPIRVYEV